MALPDTLGHLVRIEVRGLFGGRPKSFELELKEPTLLTGTNGSGKSTILKMLSAIGRGEWAQLRPLPFDSVQLVFESAVQFSISKKTPENFTADVDGQHFDVDLMRTAVDLDSLDTDLLELHFPDIAQIRKGLFEYRGRILDRDELTALLRRRGVIALDPDMHSPLIDFTNKFHTLFVTDQRLVVSEDDPINQRNYRPARKSGKSAVVVAAQEIARQMRDALNYYAVESQRLDRDFPQRVVIAMANQKEIPLKQLEVLINEIEGESAALQAVGLLPKDLSPHAFRQLPLSDANVRPVIKAFAEDTKNKFAVLSDLRERLTLFSEFLNQHYSHKQVSTNTQQGFDVEVSQGPSRSVPISQLSSGEQQILVLAYEILFRAEPGTLVLIDEPELSLHVLWQDTFIDDITAMGHVRDLQFLLATHSPTLIGGRDDLKRALDQI